MAYPDPQTVTLNAVPFPLPRTASGVNTGAFTAPDGNIKLTVSHAYNKRSRRVGRLDVSKVAPDPLIASTNIKFGMSAYLVVDVPPTGYTIAEQKITVDALIKWCTDNAGANITKLLGGEN